MRNCSEATSWTRNSSLSKVLGVDQAVGTVGTVEGHFHARNRNCSDCSELFRKGSEQLCDSDHSTVPVFPLFRGEHRNSVLVRFGTVI